VIELVNVSKNFGAKEAVRNLSLHIPRGELFCFLGPNGAGKTTTIRMLCGLLQPTAGQVRIGGLPMTKDAVDVRRIMGYIPDTPFMYERLTPDEFMELTGDLYGVPRAQVRAEKEKSFQLFGLEEYRNRLIMELSHGLRQRVAYAATFLHDPQVLLVDEPFIGLDPHSIRLIRNLLREKARAGMTILLTTHILALAEDLADRIGIILRGEIIALGTLADLLRENAVGGRLEDVFLHLTGD
jgi:ABC-2 type transport system ATP-binding protein